MLNSSETGNVIPLVSIGFTHGIRLNGVGYTDVLPMGSNTATLTITGKTTVNGEAVSLQTQVALSVFAELMDIQLYDDQAEIDMTQPQGIDYAIGTWSYKVTSTALRIKNTGNVNILLHMSRTVQLPSTEAEGGSKYVYESRDFTLTPGQTEDFSVNRIPAGPASVYYDNYFFELDGNGTIVDPDRLFITLSGKVSIIAANQ